MPYNANVPLSTQRINITQPIIQANFTELLPYGLGYSPFKNQTFTPSFDTNVNGIYNAVFSTTGINELYIHRQGTSGLFEVPFTASKMSNTNAAGSDNGWTYLPSGLLIKWGRVPATTSTVAITPTVTSGGPNFTRVFRVFVTPQDTGTAFNFNCGVRTVADNTSGNFSAYCSNPSATTGIYYLLLGI